MSIVYRYIFLEADGLSKTEYNIYDMQDVYKSESYGIAPYVKLCHVCKLI